MTVRPPVPLAPSPGNGEASFRAGGPEGATRAVFSLMQDRVSKADTEDINATAGVESPTPSFRTEAPYVTSNETDDSSSWKKERKRNALA